ncbi:Hsp90 protein-domain-containing protein, partial [Ochromonadaceae sp. CCMP2298]
LRIIKQRLVKKSIEMMSDLAKNETEYATFWRNFGKYVKIGIIEDDKSRDDLVPLLRFYSSAAANDTQTSLPEYVARMPEGQQAIYYVVGETRAQAAMSPALEKLRQKGFEVIYLCEPIDEMTLQNIDKYQDKIITDAGKDPNSPPPTSNLVFPLTHTQIWSFHPSNTSNTHNPPSNTHNTPSNTSNTHNPPSNTSNTPSNTHHTPSHRQGAESRRDRGGEARARAEERGDRGVPDLVQERLGGQDHPRGGLDPAGGQPRHPGRCKNPPYYWRDCIKTHQ